MRWQVYVVATVVLLGATACVIPMADLDSARSSAEAINDAGVVVGVARRPDGSWRAFKRFPDDTAVELATLPDRTWTAVNDINDHGVAVGLAGGGPAGSRAVAWAADGQITDLGPGNALEINDAGLVLISGPTGTEVLDSVTGELVPRPTFGDWGQIRVNGINSRGQVVGTRETAEWDAPVRWDMTTGEVVDLSTTLSDPTFVPLEINDRGTMIGYANFGRVDYAELAVVLAGSNQVVTLGTGEDAERESNLAGLGETDVVVGWNADRHPFRWRPDTGLEVLTDVAGGAEDVNESGTIVGHVNGQAAFLGFPTP
jgi:uncharacterized membrane protein